MDKRRYPGVLPFNSEQRDIFYGRKNDIQELLTIIEVEKKVLLYSKSGLGKTSLIEAGVIPRLPDNFIPISIRFHRHTEQENSPVEKVIDGLKKKTKDFDKLPDTVLDELVENREEYKTLWYYFKKIQIAREILDPNGSPKIFILFFDQFEELFSYPDEQIEVFKNQFYELTRSKIPFKFDRLIASKRKKENVKYHWKTISQLHDETSIKNVFIIRSDRLSLLNTLSDKITDIQENFYEILPLDDKQIRRVIEKPAEDPFEEFSVKPFKYDPSATEKIINKLSDEGKQEISTTQLQIVCQSLEEIVAKKQEANHGDEMVLIKEKDLPEFKNIFFNFYNSSINKVDISLRNAAKRLIEDRLILNGERVSLDENICKKTENPKDAVNEETLEILVKSHLLNASENTFGRLSYELSHDTLVEPILESRKIYEQEQAALKAEEKKKAEIKRLQKEKEKAEEEKKAEIAMLQEEQRRKDEEIKKQRNRVFWSLLISLVFIAISIFALTQWKRAGDARETADNEAKESDSLRKVAINAYEALITEQLTNYLDEGKDNMKKDEPDYELASQNFDKTINIGIQDTATNIIKLRDTIKILHDSCKKQLTKKAEFDKYRKDATKYKDEKEYIKAMTAYNNALNGYDDKTIKTAKKELYNDIKQEFDIDEEFFIEENDTLSINQQYSILRRLEDLMNHERNE